MDVLQYEASEAEAKGAELLDEVERGRAVLITRQGGPGRSLGWPSSDGWTAEAAEAIVRQTFDKAPLDETPAGRHEGDK